MPLEDAFRTFAQNLTLTQGQRQQGDERRTRLVTLLQKTWGPQRIHFIGSWARGTNIPPIKDIDLLLVLGDAAVDRQTPELLLGDIQSKLTAQYKEVSTRKQPRSIGLRFEDFGFDIVPAVPRAAGGYHIPDLNDSRRWIFTDPEKHRALAADTDRATGGMALHLVKMLKCWNANSAAGLKSFHLEVMVLRALKQPPANLAQGAQSVFESLARDVLGSCGDPGGSDNTLHTYLPADRAPYAAKLADAARRLAAAIRTESQNDARAVFGTPFP